MMNGRFLHLTLAVFLLSCGVSHSEHSKYVTAVPENVIGPEVNQWPESCLKIVRRLDVTETGNMAAVHVCQSLAEVRTGNPVAPKACVIITTNASAHMADEGNKIDMVDERRLYQTNPSEPYAEMVQDYSALNGVGTYTTVKFYVEQALLEVHQSWYQMPFVPTRVSLDYSVKCQNVWQK